MLSHMFIPDWSHVGVIVVIDRFTLFTCADTACKHNETCYVNMCSVHKHACGLVVVLPAYVSARTGANFSTVLLPTSLNCRLQSTQ